MLERQLEFLFQLFVTGNVVVSIQEAWLARCQKINSKVRWIAVDPKASPLASLQQLLKARPAGPGFFLHHIDMPVWDRKVFESLPPRAEKDPAARAAVPSFEGRRGHPVFIKAEAVPAILALDPEKDRLDLWLRGQRVVEVEVDSARIHENRNE